MLLSKVLEKKQDRQHENEMQLLLMLFVCRKRGGRSKKEETEINTRETSKEVTSSVERLIDFHWRMFRRYKWMKIKRCLDSG